MWLKISTLVLLTVIHFKASECWEEEHPNLHKFKDFDYEDPALSHYTTRPRSSSPYSERTTWRKHSPALDQLEAEPRLEPRLEPSAREKAIARSIAKFSSIEDPVIFKKLLKEAAEIGFNTRSDPEITTESNDEKDEIEVKEGKEEIEKQEDKEDREAKEEIQEKEEREEKEKREETEKRGETEETEETEQTEEPEETGEKEEHEEKDENEQKEEVSQSTTFPDSTTESTTEYRKPTSEPLSDSVWFLSQEEIDRQAGFNLAVDAIERYEDKLNKTYEDLGAMLKQISDTKVLVKHLEHIKPEKEIIDKSLIIAKMFNVTIKMRIQVRYNETYQFYVPYDADIYSTDYDKTRFPLHFDRTANVKISWTIPQSRNYTIHFGNAKAHHECYFGLETYLENQSTTRPERSWATEVLMNIEDEIVLDNGIKIKMLPMDDGTSLQYVYRVIMGCPANRGTNVGVVLISFCGPVMFLAFLLLKGIGMHAPPEDQLRTSPSAE